MKKKYLILIILCIILTSCNKSNNNLYVHFIDVGEGDCILVSLNGKNMLIDTGPLESYNKTISYLKKQDISNINYLILTHPHDDHIGNASLIINKLNINKIYAPYITVDSDAFTSLTSSAKKNNIHITKCKSYKKISFGKKAYIEILSPGKDLYDNINNYSIVIKLTYNKTSFLLMGDAEEEIENDIINSGYNIQSNVIKLGHHGSNTSSTENFLNLVDPDICIICCGENNTYNHPSDDVISRIKKTNSIIYRTDVNGDIVLVSNGVNIKKQ
ncbi:MAG: ComEC/Rec2 family competence protein [Clostridiaceae bacterium]